MVMKEARVALLACQYPGGVLDRTPAPDNRFKGMRDYFNSSSGPAERTRSLLDGWDGKGDAFVLCGDGIYIDATAGLFDPALAAADTAGAEALAVALRRAYAQAAEVRVGPALGAALRMLDDHEVIDNWEPSLDRVRDEALHDRLRVCKRVFIDRVRGGRCIVPATPQLPLPLWGPLKLEKLGLRFFLADTRTERSARDPAALDAARIMSTEQFGELLKWLDRSDDEPEDAAYRRVIVSPSIVLPRRLATAEDPAAALRSDAWDGYPRSLHDLLAALAERPALHATLLSGDEHLPCIVRAEVQRTDESLRPARLLAVHTGAMYSPYPFANGRREDFADEAYFLFDSCVSGQCRQYRCRLLATCFPPPGDGFMMLVFDADPDAEPALTWCAADGSDYPWPG
jgi:hypothetical protein